MSMFSNKVFKIIILLLAIIEPLEVKSQASTTIEVPYSIIFHFRFDQAVIDSSYLTNVSALKKLNNLLADPEIESISITTSASPEGISKHNQLLSILRAKAILSYIEKKQPYLKNKVYLAHEDVRTIWDKLYLMVKDDETLPHKTTVLSTLLNNISSDTKERQLRWIGEGASWQYLNKKYFPLLRTGTVRIIICSERKSSNIVPLPPSTINTARYLHITPEKTDSVFFGVKNEINTKKQILALKTNLLFDAATALNIELELPLTHRWSIAGEWIFPWWLLKQKQYCLQVLSGNIEGRYWLGNRELRPKMTGWFAGLYAGGGIYDIEWGTKGYQGEFYIAAGISCGYAHSINKSGSLRMEYSLGIGYLRTDYSEYEPMENGEILAWKRDGQYTWTGPTRAKISLVWMLGRKVKKGGKQ